MVLLAGCSATAGDAVNGERAEALASYARVQPSRSSDGAYILGPGDRLRLKAYSDDQLSGEYEVNSGGFVSIPLVGEVRAAGMSTSALEKQIVAKMKGKIAQDPQISIEIASYAPFYVYGEVKKAGEYPCRPGLTLADAVALAGGLTYRANEDRIFVRHRGTPAEEAIPVGAPVRVFPGDTIRVAERMF